MSDSMNTAHAALMDATYRHQRLIYDATRAWFLLGRDRAIAALAPPPEARVLELACGTGRNLAHVARRYPGRRLYGLDISREMLGSAEAKLGRRAWLAHGDACTFSGGALFDTEVFDRILLSYAVSMIPCWQEAMARAAQHLAPGGALHIVDFHDQAGLPGPFGMALRGWLARFHVTPRTSLAAVAREVAAGAGCTSAHAVLFRGYAQHAVITRPA